MPSHASARPWCQLILIVVASRSRRQLVATGGSCDFKALKWSEVDIEGEALRLGDTKTGASARPLSKRSIEVLDKIERVDGNPYVLPAARKTKGRQARQLLIAAANKIANEVHGR